MLKKIVAIGPESTGKSSLCKQLAEHYNTLWCPEYAREYLMIHGMNYTYDDLLTIAKAQVELEEKYESKIRSLDSRVKSQTNSLPSHWLTANDKKLTIDHSPLPTLHRHRHVCNEGLVRICLWEMSPSLYWIKLQKENMTSTYFAILISHGHMTSCESTLMKDPGKNYMGYTKPSCRIN
jgi:hypothetical protein